MAFMPTLPIHPIGLFGLGVVVSLFAQLGDLHESLTKRVYEVKDSSNLLPGHGGFYDRLDSYLMVLPVVYYLVYGGFWL
jgi:phosphatidate cytidylyltransferase